jgi:TPR repeat protein
MILLIRGLHVACCVGVLCFGFGCNSAPKKSEEELIANPVPHRETAQQKERKKSNELYFKGLKEWESGNLRKGFDFFKQAADSGSILGMAKVGDCYLQGVGVERDFTLAYRYLLKAAKRQHAGAQALIGLMYQHGNGVDQNLVKAYTWFLIAGRDPLVATDTLLYSLQEKMTQEEIIKARELAKRYNSLLR